MSIGNWRDHVIVNCKICLKPIGYHLAVSGTTCVDCETLPARHLKEVPKYLLRRVRTKLFRSLRGVK